MGAVICYWGVVVALTEDGTEGLGQSIQGLAEYFYSDDGLVASTQADRLQREFDVLAILFDWVGLRMNTKNMVSMAYQPCRTSYQMFSEAYERQMTGTGKNFQELQRGNAANPECREEVVEVSLLTHR